MRWQRQSLRLWISFVGTVVVIAILIDCVTGRVLQLQDPRAVKLQGLSLNWQRSNNDHVDERLGSLNNNAYPNDLENQLYALGGGGGSSTAALDRLDAQNLIRRRRAAVNTIRRGMPEAKHVDRIPRKATRVMHGTSPPPDESDEDDFETIEVNRDAFLEILSEHAKHPHRRRSHKQHSDKFQLRYDFDAQRYSLTERQSDEF